jgi:hypothetical protein
MQLFTARSASVVIVSMLAIQCLLAIYYIRSYTVPKDDIIGESVTYDVPLDEILPYPLSDFFAMPELSQQIFYDEFMKRHPMMNARYLTKDDFIDRASSYMTKETSVIRNEILECMVTTPISELPRYEDYLGEDWWMTEKSFCDKPYFQVFRREQNIAKILYCLGKRSDVKVVLDIFAGFGGASLPIAAGMKKSGQLDKYVITYEAHPYRAKISTERLKNYPAKIIFDSTLIPYTFNPKNSMDQLAEGNIMRLCTTTKVSAMFMDAVGSMGTSWETPDDIQEGRRGQEFPVIRDVCKPKYILVTRPDDQNTGETVDFWIRFTQERRPYEVVMDGFSRGIGCHSTNTALRRWFLLVRTK